MSTNGRDEGGRFAPGNPGGPGRPPRATEADYLEALRTACPPERFAELLEHHLSRPNGSHAFRVLALVAKYLLPAPPAAGAEDGADASGEDG